MIKMKKSALMSAIALTSAFGLASCSSTEDDGNINPTFDGQSVKTQFAINIPRAAGNNGTRATADQTQGEGANFLGMEGIVLRPINGTSLGTAINLGDTKLGAATGDQSNGLVKVYDEVEVPTGTKNFLFYGFAIAPENANSNKFITGALSGTNNLNENSTTATTDISFKLENINSETISTEEGTQQAAILKTLNAVMQATGFKDATSANISKLYNDFAGLNAGSATSVKQALQNLLNKLGELADIETVRSAVETAITNNDYFTVTDHKVSFKNNQTVFPRNYSLPDGIAKLQSTSGVFTYDFSKSTLADGGMTIDSKSITYPARLSYYVSTPIRTKNTGVNTSDWPATASAWTQQITDSWGDGDEVTSSTRAIALKNNINYGVASLKLTVKCNSNLADDNDATVTIPEGGFTVTGLLLGGQPSSVGYDFQPNDNSEQFGLTVYDNFSTPLYATTDASNANYTILLPSQEVTAEDGSVLFALELENGGTEFKGKDGIIPAGARFYLIGKLNPADNKNTSLNPTGIKRIFMSDYQTTANVTISSLKNAYNVIPDIRNTKMQLGLSVDLTWKEGYSFDTTIGGDN